jgi:hypothetical protein
LIQVKNLTPGRRSFWRDNKNRRANRYENLQESGHIDHPVRRDEPRQAATGSGFATLKEAAAEANEPVHAA